MRLLIVEDEVSLAEALKEILKKHNYMADAVHDGITGFDYAISGIYDVIILDIMLPKMNGIDVLQNIRKEKVATAVLRIFD